MKLLKSLIILAVLTAQALAQNPTSGLRTLSVAAVTTNQALVYKVDRKGKALDLGQTMGSLRTRQEVAFSESKKFKMIEDAGAGALVERLVAQNASGVFDPKTLPKEGKLKVAEFLVYVNVDHFVDSEATAVFADGARGYRRRLQLSGTVKIINTTSGEIFSGGDVNSEVKDSITLPQGETIETEKLENLLPKLFKDFTEKVVQSTETSVFPMKVLDAEDGVVTINRNNRSGLVVGETLSVFGPGKLIKDEDSGSERIIPGAFIGKVRITSTDNDFSQAQIVEEKEKGKIQKGCFLRRITSP